jgi:membrane dipeptidase
MTALPTLLAKNKALPRRHFAAWMAAALGGLAGWPTQAASEIFISDTHSHSSMSAREPKCMRCELQSADVTLMSWALVADGPFIQRLPNGAMQVNLKATPEQFREAFQRMLSSMQRRIERESLKLVRTPQDVDRALAGELHIVLSTEGAQYLGGDAAFIDAVYGFGVRQIGLGHFVEGDLLDIRTEAPKLGGLSLLGREVIRRCNALGIVVDLAHATDQAVAHALEVSTQPMLWSHSAIARQPNDWRSRGNHVMSIGLPNALELAKRGGVIGVWPSRFNFDNQQAYVAGLQEAIGMVGEDHVAFGTDMHGLAPASTMIDNYSGLRDIVNRMLASNMPESTVRKVAGENYARLLKAVFQARQAA